MVWEVSVGRCGGGGRGGEERRGGKGVMGGVGGRRVGGIEPVFLGRCNEVGGGMVSGGCVVFVVLGCGGRDRVSAAGG